MARYTTPGHRGRAPPMPSGSYVARVPDSVPHSARGLTTYTTLPGWIPGQASCTGTLGMLCSLPYPWPAASFPNCVFQLTGGFPGLDHSYAEQSLLWLDAFWCSMGWQEVAWLRYAVRVWYD